MVRQQHASPPHPANQTEMYDHNQMSQQLREERRKEYNDYLVSGHVSGDDLINQSLWWTKLLPEIDITHHK